MRMKRSSNEANAHANECECEYECEATTSDAHATGMVQQISRLSRLRCWHVELGAFDSVCGVGRCDDCEREDEFAVAGEFV